MAHHGSRRIGVGDYSRTVRHPFTREFLDRDLRASTPHGSTAPRRLTYRLGDVAAAPPEHQRGRTAA